ncbi:MAG: hypothetical protein HQL39_01155 [Alphaproteobacteria bacterium]|nr:hypothetical protein [Alphaproteobacteria bacterium]
MGDITIRGNSQLQPQRINDRADGFVSGMGAGRDSLVQAFPPQLRLLGDLAHATRLGDVAKRGQEDRRIWIFQGRRQVFGHHLAIVEVAGDVERRDRFHHGSCLLDHSGQFLGPLDVPNCGDSPLIPEFRAGRPI